MADDRGDDLNFNELVGSLLSSHNADENRTELDTDPKSQEDQGSITHEEGGEELPEFGAGEEDDALAAVVANAIQNMDDEEPAQVEEVDIPRGENFEEQENEQQEDQQWANILQQGLLQGTDAIRHDGSHQEEQLDPDDENLRRAILESLGELNVADRETSEKDSKVDTKGKSKKASKKKKKKDKDHTKEKSTNGKKKKSHKKDKKDREDLLDFEDVIKGFMKQGADVAETQESEEVGDAETQALVEATLKAFENELLGSQTAPSAAKSKTTSRKKLSTTKLSTSARENEKIAQKDMSAEIPSAMPLEAPKKKKKKKKLQTKVLEKPDAAYEEDEFSRALAEMVNEVVKTSLTETTTEATEAPEEPIPEPITAVSEAQAETAAGDNQEEPAEESFDLNQIMQRAMSMAFQEQTPESIDNAAMEEFNRGLRDLNVSDILDSGKHKKKAGLKPSRKKSIRDETKAKGASKEFTVPQKGKTSKPAVLEGEVLRKKYYQAVTAAAAAARKRISANNKAHRLQLKSERKKAREDRRLQKKKAKEQLELERKELEVIVAKGPPYPPDLRLTKSGKPKKPYRRWTPEEMEKRASMPPEELQAGRVKKPRKKKLKKLKKIPLSTLKKIPIFNFARGNGTTENTNKLNGIEETLKRIPLQPYHLDINKLAPPDTMPPEQWQKERTIKEEERAATKINEAPNFFDAARKTVVRREKIPFHPPWVLPCQVPFALPVARRRRKEKTYESKRAHHGTRERRYSRGARDSFGSSARARIIPAVLLPIIKTLKAAARAKSASGASSEEASRHLVTIIRHTKRTIAHTLSTARRQSVRGSNLSIKPESKSNGSISEALVRKVPRNPIFSLARIKQIDTSDDAASIQNDHTANEPPSIIKLEDENPFDSFATKEEKRPEDQAKNALNANVGESAGAGENYNRHLQSDRSKEEEVLKNDSANGHDEPVESRSQQYTHNEEVQQSSATVGESDGGTREPFTEINKEDAVANQDTKEKDSNKDGQVEGITAHIAKESTVTNSAAEIPITRGLSEVGQEGARQQPALTDKQNRLSQIKTEVSSGSGFDQNSLNFLKETVDQSELKGEHKVLDVLNSLVKHHLDNSEDSSVALSDDVRNVISATIEELIPAINEQEKPAPQPKRRKGPPPVLNLDGIVPPSRLSYVPKIEETPRPLSVSKSKVRKPRKKAEQPALLYAFDVPDFKNTQGRRTMLLRRAKNYLTNDEMNTLKKEINKERKRKWREANVEKNWENDLRARLKKRANAKFGDSDTIEKTKWYQDEVNKSLAERGIKHEDTEKSGDLETDKKISGSTNLSDNEVLNMIATTLNKLEVARLLEQELNEDAASFSEGRNNRRKRLDAPNESENSERSVERLDISAVMNPNYDEQESLQERVVDRGAVDELDEHDSAKRPYPDDIPVIVPLTKRPKALNTQVDK